MRASGICPGECSHKLLTVSQAKHTVNEKEVYLLLDILDLLHKVLPRIDTFWDCHLLCKNDNLESFVEIFSKYLDLSLWSVYKFPIICILRKLLTRFSWNYCRVLNFIKIKNHYYQVKTCHLDTVYIALLYWVLALCNLNNKDCLSDIFNLSCEILGNWLTTRGLCVDRGREIDVSFLCSTWHGYGCLQSFGWWRLKKLFMSGRRMLFDFLTLTNKLEKIVLKRCFISLPLFSYLCWFHF